MAAEVQEGLELDGRAEGTAEQTREQLPRGLHAALRPPALLHQKRSRCTRKLRRHADIVAHDEPPAGHLGAVADVEVLGEGVVLPAACVDEGLAAPKPRGAVEVEEAAAAVARTLLHQEVAVEEETLGPGQPRRRLVEVVPAGLHHPDARVGHRGQQSLEEVGMGNEVRVEDENVLTGRRFQARGESARLVAGAVLSVVDRDVEAALPPAPGAPPGEEGGLVGGVVQDLDLEARTRVRKPAGRIDEPLGDVFLVVDGELDGDAGWWGAAGHRRRAHRCLSPRQGQQQQPMSGEGQQQGQHQPVERHRRDAEELSHRPVSGRGRTESLPPVAAAESRSGTPTPARGRIPMNPRCRPVSPRRCEK